MIDKLDKHKQTHRLRRYYKTYNNSNNKLIFGLKLHIYDLNLI